MMLKIFLIPIISITSFPFCLGKMDPYVVEGDYASIERFPHSAFLNVACKQELTVTNWICGSSIINQKILLTAGHCLDGCSKSTRAYVVIGNAHRVKGTTSSVEKFVVHEKYNTHHVNNDIALVKLKTPLRLNSRVKRVALMKRPPSDNNAFIAGWGLVNEITKIGTVNLMYTMQKVWKREKCLKVLRRLPEGVICAGAMKSRNYASEGDSGSALVIRDYIQIGLVSYKTPSISRSLVVYTDVAYYYDWIQNNAKKLYCDKN